MAFSAPRRFAGRIVFGADAVPFERATVHVWLEDTTYADAPSRPLAQWTSRDVRYPKDGNVPFDLFATERLMPDRRYTFRALVDVDDDGAIGVGDYVTVESIAIERDAGTTVHDVRVRRVGG